MATEVEVWTQRSYDGPKVVVETKCVWRGQMYRVPVPGELVVVHDGFAGETVKRVFHNLYDGTAMVEIGPDSFNEYPPVAEREKANG